MGHQWRQHHSTLSPEKCKYNRGLYKKSLSHTKKTDTTRGLIARKLSDFKKTKDRYVRATADVFWEALEANLLPKRD